MTQINLALNTLKQKGDLAYEYNPFYNYLTNVDLYEVDGFIIPKGTAVNINNGQIYHKKLTLNNREIWVDNLENVISINATNIKKAESGSPYAKAGSLVELDTDLLNFDLEHPVDITVQPSYDGSVNLILNDGKNIPRLINSRFSVREKNTYEIVDRIGENDTNIYSSDNFEKDSSLYFLYETNPKIIYNELIRGILPVGQYCFYLTYCDADNNESDIIAESGLIPVFKGLDGDPKSIDGGIKNESSNKGIKLTLTNLDKSYNYVKIYYVRYFADYQLNRVIECKKLYLKYPIFSNYLTLQITGNENTEDLDPEFLNAVRFNPKNVKTQAQCKNMLFFGNIVKNVDDYRELQDCALRIFPTLNILDIETPNKYYASGKGYYNSVNMYTKVGYFNLEYYRFGVVFIYKNGTLSNVYNTSGYDITDNDIPSYIKNSLYEEIADGIELKRKYIKIDDFGKVLNKEDYILNFSKEVNARGVCKIESDSDNYNKTIGIKFNIPYEVTKHLKEDLGIRGLFFVRLKRVPNILALCAIMPVDEVLQAPVITDKSNFWAESFITQNSDKLVINDYSKRLYKFTDRNRITNNRAYAGICPDFLLNLPYYNQIFNGGEFYLLKVSTNSISVEGRNSYYNPTNNLERDSKFIKVKLCTVTEDVPTVAIEDNIYRLNIGNAREAYRFRVACTDTTSFNLGEGKVDSNATNFVRGVYSPYIAIYSETKLEYGSVYNIYQNILSSNEYQTRMDSSEPFYAISDRYNFDELNLIGITKEHDSTLTCFRGDCYSNRFTYRLNRNFNDSTLPNNDSIIDTETWKKNYESTIPEKWKNISRSDINAVQMGHWITFLIQSSINYALRSLDNSYVSETATMGNPRSFVPRSGEMYLGDYKMPDSYLYNDAYRAILGFKTYYTLQDINYIKDTFSNRILYSAIAIQDSFKNNYRESFSTYYRDYSTEYGGITRLVGFEGYLLVVFEHAIGVAVINERILAGSGDGEPVFINTHNVLPEELTIITDTYGSLWSESIIKSEGGYVYGIDTIAKKIWRVKGQLIEILSDFKVNKFLIDNISLGEKERKPYIGLKNVKTHYNNNKKDIIFTFYDDYYKDEEKVWSLCYNELLNQFVTFYSWVPSYSENIDTQFFTFNRKTSKNLSLIKNSNYYIKENTGVLMENILFNRTSMLHYKNSIGEELLANFAIEKDHWRNCDKFYIGVDGLTLKEGETIDGVIILYITPTVDGVQHPTESIAFTTLESLKSLTTDFYLHGNSGIINLQQPLYPTYWYDEYHPFEFEFVVNDKIGQLKIFNNLILISNKAEPESFHFEVEGDNYEFSSDKRVMYFRQEATKELYQNLGSDIIFNRDYKDVVKRGNTLEQYYRSNDNEYTKQYSKMDNVYPVAEVGLVLQIKSNIFPLYYEKIDYFNEIAHGYQLMKDDDGVYGFLNLSGSEISWDRKTNQFNIITHIKNTPIDRVGVMRGNSMYSEGKWDIQIPTIQFMLKNESTWPLSETDGIRIPPIVINSSYVPKDVKSYDVSQDNLPNMYCGNNIIKYLTTSPWTSRKEARIRDKWMKVRVRYSGKNLAIIHSLITLYNISYN